MAAGLFRKKIGEASDWRIESAGTWGVEGEPAAGKSRVVLGQRGIDISQHRSRTVTRELLNSFNLILTMEAGHAEALRAEFPEIARRVFLITEMIGKGYNIQDPVGGPLEEFEMTARELEQIFDQGFGKISELARD
jgi:protein-tyrosine-phosphatase